MIPARASAPSAPDLGIDGVVSICRAALQGFQRHSAPLRHEIKGVLNSEMLMFCALARHLEVDAVLESGRARGNSTELLAAFFTDSPRLPVISVEYLRYTEDSVIALRRLGRRHRHLDLRFGDAFYLLPGLCARFPRSAVLIDGPKGKYALQLAARLLASPAVRAVFIHDSHKDSEVRPAIEALYPGAIFSDAPSFVEAFGDLDGPCWDIYRTWEGYRDWGPYVRGERRMRSYGPTLTMIVNRPGGIDCEAEVVERFGIPPLPHRETPARRLRRALRSIVPRAAEIPWVLPYVASRLSRRP